MPEGTYSAGTIFLQVVPVFRDVQDRIAENAKDWDKALGDGLEKSGREAGKRANKAIGDELGKDLDKAGERAANGYAGHFESRIKGLVDSANREFARMKPEMFETVSDDLVRIQRQLKRLSNTKITPDFSAKEMLAEIDVLEARLTKFSREKHEVNLNADIVKALKDIRKVQEYAQAAAKEHHEIHMEVKADLKQADRAMGSFEKRFRETARRAADSFGDSFNHKIRQVQGELIALSDTEINLDMDASAAMKDLAEVKAYLETVLSDETINIDVRSDVKGAVADIEAFQKAVGAIEPQVERASGAFERKLRQAAKNGAKAIGDETNTELNKLKARMEALGDVEIGVDMDAETARAEVRAIEAELRALAKSDVEIDVNLAATAAYGELFALRQLINKLDGKEIDIRVDGSHISAAAASMGLLNRVTGLFTPAAAQAGGAGDAAANSFRSFNFVILAAVTLLPALIPMLAALGGGLLALLPILGAVTGGLGVMVIGFSGIGDAVKAMGDVEKNAAKDTEAASQKIRDAAYAVADAERALADARRSAGQASADAARAVQDAERQAGQASADAARQVAAARQQAADAVENAIERQADAQRAYRDAVQEVHDAERDLAEARRAGFQEIDDTNDAIKQNALDERQGLVDVFDATVNYEAVMADGSSTNLDKEKAAIALEQARLRLEEIREEEKRLAAEKKKHDKDGVKGTEAVQSAQDALTAALEAQQEAQENLGDAAEAVDEARVAGAQAVADALRNQQQVAADGARAIADARRNQARTEASGARSVANAQRALERSQERYQDALTETGEIGSASMQKLEDAMGKLSPAGRDFARFIFGLRKGFRSLRGTIQESLLPPIQRGMTAVIMRYGPGFEKWAGRMAAVVGGFFEQMGADLVLSPAWQGFFDMVDRLGPSMLETFGDTTLNWMEVFASLMTTLAPYGERLNNALLGLSESARDWAQSAKGTEAIQRFMDYAFEVGPEVVDFFWNLFRALAAIGTALAPWGEMVMNGLSAFFDYIATMDPALLSLIASSLITIAIAFQLAVGAAALAFAGAAVFASAGSRYVFFAVLIAGALAGLYHRFEFVRDIVDTITGFFKDHMNIIMGLVKIYLIYTAVMKTYVALTKGGVIYTAIQNGLIRAQIILINLQSKAMKIWAFTMRIVTGVMKAMRVAAALMFGPWGLAIVAVVALFVLLYKKVGWFRDAVDKVVSVVAAIFRKIVDAAFWVWDQLFGHSIFPDIVDGLVWFFGWVEKIAKWVGEAFVWLYEHFLEPVGKAILALVKWLWTYVIKPYMGFIVAYWKTVFRAMGFAWEHILKPAIQALIAIVKFLWKTIIKPYLGFVVAYWKTVFRAMKFVWDNVLKPVFNALKATFTFLWEKVVRPILGWIGEKFETVFRAMAWVWDNVLKPVFDAIRDRALPALKRAFETAVENIQTAWATIKKIVGKPIEFVVNTVIRDGLIAGFNKVSSFVKGPEIDFPGVDFKYATGGVFGRRERGFATGGVMPGYTPGQDVHHFTSPTGGRLHLSGGEAIMRPEFTAAVGSGWVDSLNSAARAGGVKGVRSALGLEQRFASGGKVVFPVPKGWYIDPSPYNVNHDGVDINHPNDSGPNGQGGSVIYMSATSGKVSYTGYDRGYGNAVFVNSPYGELVYGHSYPGSVRVKAGQEVAPGMTLGLIGTTGNSSAPHLHFGYPGGTYAAARALLNGSPTLDGGVKGLKSVDERFPGWLIDIAKNPVGYVKGLITKPLEGFEDSFGDMGDFTGMITDVPKAIAGKVSAEIWNMIPEPVQDFVGGAKAVFEGAKDFGGDVIGGIGDAGGAVAGFLGFGGEGGAYRRGGVLPHNGTMMYDDGGYLPPGLTTVVNLTGKPEPVFTSDQFERMGSGGSGQGGFHYEPHFEGSDLTPAEVATDIDRAYRKMKRQGKYGKQG